MDPLEKIILTALLGGAIALVIGATAVAAGFWVIMKDFSLLGSSTLSLLDKAGLALSAAILIACVLICPALAFYLRDSIFSLGLNSAAQIVIFAFISLSHLILFIPSYYTVPAIFKYLKMKVDARKAKRTVAFLALIKDIERAGARVRLLRSRIMADDGLIIRAEFTLAIENMPLIIPGYAVRMIGAGPLEKFHVPRIVTGGAVLKPSTERNIPIIAVNEKDRWVFYDHVKKTVLSRSQAHVAVEINIERTPEAGSEVPRRLSISLGAWRQQFRSYPTGRQFFIQTFPIVFE